MIKIGIIGAGKIVPHHLAVFRDLEDVQVTSISNRTKSKAQSLAEEFSIPQVYDSYHELLKQDLDAVCVFTSPDTIAPITLDCIRANKHCLIEKPAGLITRETEELAQEAAEHNVQVMVGANRRFLSAVQQAKEIISKEQLRSIIVEAPERFTLIKNNYNYSKQILKRWIVANGIHCLDLLRFFGGETESVVSKSSLEANNYHALINFKNNVVGHYYANWDSPGSWNVTLITNQHKIILDPLEKGVVIDEQRNKKELTLSEVDQKYKPGLYEQNKLFVEVINKGSTISRPACSIQEAVETMKFIDQVEGEQ